MSETADPWWVACHQYAWPRPFKTEERAEAKARELDTSAHCEDPHFYWPAAKGPRVTTETDYHPFVHIPEGAKRVQ